MSKFNKIIAGLGVVAGLGVAAAPLSAFATTANIGQDTFSVTVDSACSLKTTGGADWTAWSNAYTAQLTPNSIEDFSADDATTSVKVVCNQGGAYEIQAVGTVLAGQGNAAEDEIPLVDPASGTSGWGAAFAVSGTGLTLEEGFGTTHKALPATATKIASQSNATVAGETFTVSGYKVSTDAGQMAGTYTGSATYTLVYGAN